MAEIRRWAIVLAIGALAGALWIRLGLYGFGLPIGMVTLLPALFLLWHYLAARQLMSAAALVGSLAGVWATFEAGIWLNAASDRAVEIPGWSPVPLAVAVALVIVSLALAAGARWGDALSG